MQVIVNGDLDDINNMIISAVRYALRRRTYIVSWTCEFVKRNLHIITGKHRTIIIRDIKEQQDYGDDCDKKEWLELLKVLEEA